MLVSNALIIVLVGHGQPLVTATLVELPEATRGKNYKQRNYHIIEITRFTLISCFEHCLKNSNQWSKRCSLFTDLPFSQTSSTKGADKIRPPRRIQRAQMYGGGGGLKQQNFRDKRDGMILNRIFFGTLQRHIS